MKKYGICASCGYRFEKGDSIVRVEGSNEEVHYDCFEDLDGEEALKLFGIEFAQEILY